MVDEVIVETSLKERRKAFWGYMAPMDAFDAMISACIAIEEDGDPLNRETLKKRSGVTYNNALAATLALYKRRKNFTDQFKETPATLLHVIAQHIEEQLVAQKKEFTTAVEQERKLFVDSLDEGVKAYDEQVEEVETLKAQLTAIQDDLKNAQLNIEELKGSLSSLENEKNTLGEKYHRSLESKQQLEGELKELRHSMEDLKLAHQSSLEQVNDEKSKAIDELKAQHNQQTAQLTARWDSERSTWQKDRDRLETSLSDTEESNQYLSRELDEAKLRLGSEEAEKNRLMQENQSIKPLLEVEKKYIALCAEDQSKTKEIQALGDTIESLKRDNQELRDKLSAQTNMIDMIKRLEDKVQGIAGDD
jgi:chromosome segregation ATPase